MSEYIKFENGKYGTKAIIQTEWQDSFLKLLLNNNVKELELNDGKGWRGDNVDFLKSFPELKSLTIIRLNLNSIEPIQTLHNLVELVLSTYSEKGIDFSAFPSLKICFFEWIKKSDSLFECNSLENLGLNGYGKESSELFSGLVNLKRLAISNSKIKDLHGIVELRELNYLRLANLRKLTSLGNIKNLKNLRELEIQRCKGISSVSEIFQLNRLKRLLLIDLGNIDSINGIEKLMDLEEFLFYESTNILDGDISPVLSLKKLKNISFQNRNHYSHHREDFEEIYYSRSI